jgi:uncharacterized Zn finger protein
MERAISRKDGGAAVTTKNDKKKGERATGAACPQCGSRLVISRISKPAAASDGREGYFVQCHECGTWLTGTIDPNDEAFLPL